MSFTVRYKFWYFMYMVKKSCRITATSLHSPSADLLDICQFTGLVCPGQLYSLAISGPGNDQPTGICFVRTKKEAWHASNMLIEMMSQVGGQFQRFLGIEKLSEPYHYRYVIRLLFTDSRTGEPGIVKLKLERLLTFKELAQWANLVQKLAH